MDGNWQDMPPWNAAKNEPETLRFGRTGEVLRYALPFDESKHKRGQPENAGEFGPGGGGGSRSSSLTSPSAVSKPAAPAAAPPQDDERARKLAQLAFFKKGQDEARAQSAKAVQEAQLEQQAKSMPPWNHGTVKQAAEEYRTHGTRAKAFKDWFGDWEADPSNASKVVNQATGEPQKTHEVKKVFHGTLASFDAFSKQHAGQHGSVVGRGFYFAEDERIATAYLQGAKNQKPIEAYLSIKNPFDFDQEFGIEELRGLAAKSAEAMSKLPGFGSEDLDKRMYQREVMTEFGKIMGARDTKKLHGVYVHAAVSKLVGPEKINDVVGQLGYDGITHLSRDEAGTPWLPITKPDGSTLSKEFGRCWIAFEPHQIKSTDNAGTFHPEDERFRYSAGLWEEQKHPRGQPENKGEFSSAPGGGGSGAKPDAGTAVLGAMAGSLAKNAPKTEEQKQHHTAAMVGMLAQQNQAQKHAEEARRWVEETNLYNDAKGRAPWNTGGPDIEKRREIRRGWDLEPGHAESKTREGVPYAKAKSLTPEEVGAALSWHDGLTFVEGTNTANGALPNESRPQLNDMQRGSLQKYTYRNDRVLNSLLRGREDWDKNSAYGKEFFRTMHQEMQGAFKSAPVMAKPIRVVRGMSLDDKTFDQFTSEMVRAHATGDSVQFDGYTSTTRPSLLKRLAHAVGLSKNPGVEKPFRGNIALKINAIHGLDMSPHSQLPSEREFLLNHGSEFRVKSINKGAKEWTIELDQLPPNR